MHSLGDTFTTISVVTPMCCSVSQPHSLAILCASRNIEYNSFDVLFVPSLGTVAVHRGVHGPGGGAGGRGGDGGGLGGCVLPQSRTCNMIVFQRIRKTRHGQNNAGMRPIPNSLKRTCDDLSSSSKRRALAIRTDTQTQTQTHITRLEEAGQWTHKSLFTTHTLSARHPDVM